MKIRKLFLSLVISGVSLGSAAAQEPIKDPAPATSAPASRNASRHIGDAVPAVAESGGPSNLRMAQYDVGMQQLAPAATNYQPNMSAYDMGSGCNSCGQNYCGTSCGNNCGCSSNLWFGAETLLWWGQKRQAPPLLTSSGQGVLPVAGTPGVTTVVGGPDAELDSGLLPGYRVSGGMYFGPEKRVGVSGRVFGIYRNTDTTSLSSDGSTSSIGLPFFNTLIGQPDAYLVAFNNGVPVASGTASVTSKLDLLAAEPSLRLLVSDSCDHRIDLLGGYTYLRLRDSVGISSTSTDTFTGNLIPDGTVFQTNDLFAAENQFHGGHLGLQNTVSRERISLTTLSKVSFGNMHESGFITGSTAVGLPPATPTVTPGGIYTQQSNIGSFSRDSFAFIPELGVKGGLAIRNNLQLTAGYTFLYVSKVALGGDQINPNIDLSQAQGGAAAIQPAFNFREGSMWFQGIDLGMNWTF
jgi:hypothetical protein